MLKRLMQMCDISTHWLHWMVVWMVWIAGVFYAHRSRYCLQMKARHLWKLALVKGERWRGSGQLARYSWPGRLLICRAMNAVCNLKKKYDLGVYFTLNFLEQVGLFISFPAAVTIH